jgi:uncharacterized phage-associated protein
MLQGYDALALSNRILDRWNAHERSITNKKINKLLFYCHGFALARLNTPLLKNHIEAWTHGPVVKSVYHAFKEFDHRPIGKLATAFDYVAGRPTVVWQEFESHGLEELFFNVCDYYSRWSADGLEHDSHAPGSPWAMVMNRPRYGPSSNRISNHSIRLYFQERFGNKIS